MQQSDLNEIKRYVKELTKKLRREGSTSDGAGAFATPKAFVGNSKAKGSAKGLAASTAFTKEPSKKKKFFIGYKNQGEHLSDIKEGNYRQFKEDASVPQHKKINQAVLEINRKINEINRLLNHSAKLKTEAQIGDEKLWKRSNEALLKIHKRLSEAGKRIKEFADLKEIEANSLKAKMVKMFAAAEHPLQLSDVEIIKRGAIYNIDVYIAGEPHAFDLDNDFLTYQDFDKEIELGNINKEQEIVDKLKAIL
jgi:DNA-binding transcriptional MerR regulator